VRKALGVHPYRKHATAMDNIRHIGLEKWKKLFTFSFVRNPWDRFVSWWMFILQNKKHDRRRSCNPFACYVMKHASTFEEFLLCNPRLAGRSADMWLNQIDYISYDSGGIAVNFVGRFETLQEDFEKLCELIGAEKKKLEHVNGTEHKHYTEYYTPSLRDLVAEKYARDIEEWGYAFGGEL
jgi:hypothetical protein